MRFFFYRRWDRRTVPRLLAFFLTDLFHCLVLWAQGHEAWAAGAWLFLRETCVSLPLCVPAAALFSAVFRRTHLDD